MIAAAEARQTAESLIEVGATLSRSLDPQVVGQAVVDAAVELVRAERAAVYQLTEDRAHLRRMAVHGPAGDWMLVLEADSGAAGRAAREQRVVIIPDVLHDPDTRWTAAERAHVEAATCLAALAAPLVARDRVIGALVVRARTGREFTDDDARLARGLANHAAVALDNARLYAELRAAYDDLSRTQRQLAEARQLETVGHLAGGLAHHFNNLLAVITGRCHMMLWTTVKQDPHRGGLEQIKRTADEATTLVRQLLAFARRQLMQPRRVDLNEMIGGLGGLLAALGGDGIEVRHVLEASPAWVMADPAQLENVLVTLVARARDAMPDGGRVVVATARRELRASGDLELPPGQYVVISVDDTGRGLDGASRARIFEPFFPTDGPGTGRGLQLASVYGIVKQSGGGITVDSAPGRGTRFEVYLPAAG